MSELLVRDVMRIGVPTCHLEDQVAVLAAQMIEQNATMLVVLDEDGDTRGWINESRLASAYLRRNTGTDGTVLTAADIMDESVPECPVDIPLSVAVQIMADSKVDHLIFLHRAGGRAWPASVLSQRDIVRALGGPQFVSGQGAGAPRPTPMDLFRERYRR
jgi:predicted transcriptional regulator